MKSAMVLRQIDDYDIILREQFGFSCVKEKCGQTYRIPADIGQGFIRNVFPNEDIGLSIMHMKLKRPLMMNYEDYDSKFETTCCLKGRIVYNETGVIDTQLSQNEMGIYIKQSSRGMMMFPSGEEILAVSLLGQNRFWNNLPYKEESVIQPLGEKSHLANVLMRPRTPGVQLYNLFGQLANNSLDPSLRLSFYEGGAKLILSSLWQAYVIDPLTKNIKNTDLSADRAALFDARDILTEQYMKPPTIPELARMVALNEYRLKRGFKELFGKTVHEFTQGLKMSNAKALLENREMNISQIAYEVGYLNVSHFTRAFRKVHGMNPSDLRF
ncbi:transcriptional regulator, AraC family [Syntrophobotulus glycolicus DSM 8271]|uniref:Transcriptional regulator, AraC family n=1 Tax=Syntrophobotulus glycolicus (strain DSM 8271 / FlGlyR) TaxID=645991 RepID=F0SZN1_SYNGF|nr:AraC family transcriptional regulator [Syntrophobotulus glycolicus]ADY56117.1 transcriptional regulator, AraC family [Syntrophobotulus glycolicus DSM 8271]